MCFNPVGIIVCAQRVSQRVSAQRTSSRTLQGARSTIEGASAPSEGTYSTAAAGSGPRPSSGVPSASSTRPSTPKPTGKRGISSLCSHRSSADSCSGEPNSAAETLFCCTATTCARRRRSQLQQGAGELEFTSPRSLLPSRLVNSTKLPSAASDKPSTDAMPCATSTTLPVEIQRKV